MRPPSSTSRKSAACGRFDFLGSATLASRLAALALAGVAALAASRRSSSRRSSLALLLAGACSGLVAGSCGRRVRAALLGRAANGQDASIRLAHRQRVERSPEDLYRLWRQLECLPSLLPSLESVELLGTDRSRWTLRTRFGERISWEALIVQEVPDRLLAWRSAPGGELVATGTVRFEPDGTGATWLAVELEYQPLTGAMQRALTGMFGRSPSPQLARNLARFEELVGSDLEVLGEVCRLELATPKRSGERAVAARPAA
ncbi:MAG: SRPBCC family protein [Verrucomicrobia bacterium]|nr:SRPBCC family protein [Verrucomicrobiota bacterium]